MFSKVAMAALSLGLVASQAFAIESDLTIKVESTNVKSVYTLGANNAYQSSENVSRKHQTITATGILAGYVNKEETKTESQVIGKDIPGYDQISFAQAADGRIYMTRQYRAEVSAEDEKIVIEDTAQGEVTLVSGTWNDYLSGKTVTLSLTSEASRVMTKSIEKQLEVALKKLAKMFESQGIDIRDIKVKPIKVISEGLHTLNQKEFVNHGGVVELQISMELEADL